MSESEICPVHNTSHLPYAPGDECWDGKHANTDRPVLADPGTCHEYDEDGNVSAPSVRWDLSWGCALTIGYEDGQLVALVSTSDKDQRDGITRRAVTHEQVAHYAHQLLALGNEEYRTALQGLYAIASKVGVDPKWSDGAQDLIGRINMLGIEPLQKRAIAAEEQLGDIRHALASEGFCAPDTDEWTSLANIRARIQDLADRANGWKQQAQAHQERQASIAAERDDWQRQAIDRTNDAAAERDAELGEAYRRGWRAGEVEKEAERAADDSQVERVARALMRVQHQGCLAWEDESEELRGHLTDQARAAIAALRGGNGA